MISRRDILRAGLYGGLSAVVPICGCSSRRRARRNIIVILIDTLRPDYLGLYGFVPETAAFIRKLAGESVVFERAFSTSSWTAPSTASLLTSKYPRQHGVIEGFYCHKFRMEKFKKEGKAELPLNRISTEALTMPQILKSAGYTTFGIAANINIGAEIGFDRGFDSFERINDAPADVLLERVQKLKTQLTKSSPFLLYLHFNDPHTPYLAHEGYYRPESDSRANSKAKYISEIGYADEYVGKCVSELMPDGEGVLVVVSDHGEEFWDHGLDGHRPRLYRELTQVLMLLHAPSITRTPQRVGVNVGLLDVLPTIADLAGVQVEQKFEGVSLAPLLSGSADSQSLIKNLDARTLFAHRMVDTGEQELWAAIHKNWNFIQWPDGRTELFNHSLDLAEKNNVSSRNAGISAQLTDALSGFKKLTPLAQTETTQVQLDEKLVESLKSLGYVE